MSQTIWPLGWNLLSTLEKCNIKPHIPFLIKFDHFFLKEQHGSTHIGLDSNFSDDDQNSEFARKYWKTKLRNTMR